MNRLLCILSGMNAGGAETFLMKVYRKLDKTKYQMDFCINEIDKCLYEDEIKMLGGRIYRIPCKSENRKEFKKQLYNIVNKNKYYNVLRITSSAAGFLDLKIAKSAGATHTIARSSNASDGGSLKSIVVHKLGKLLWIKYVDTMIAPSDLAAIYTFGKKNYYSGRVHKLNNGIDLDIFKYDEQKRKEIRDKYHIPQTATVIGHVGRFSLQKNHEVLIDIFYEYHKQYDNSFLLLVGDGTLREKIEEKVIALGLVNNVVFTGIVSDTPAVYSAMDVFVFPSLYEGMPNTVIEAQATGLPCVISNTITKEADITGLVKYVSLECTPEEWVKIICAESSIERSNKSECFVQKRYDINTVVTDFISYVFGSNRDNQNTIVLKNNENCK